MHRAALLLVLAIAVCPASEPGWTDVPSMAPTSGNLHAAVRAWYRFAGSRIEPMGMAGARWRTARVNGDLVLGPDAARTLRLRDDGMVEERPLSAEEAIEPASADDLQRAAIAVAALAMLRTPPPLDPSVLRMEVAEGREATLRWETRRNGGPMIGFTADQPVSGRMGWRRSSCRACGCVRSMAPPDGKG